MCDACYALEGELEDLEEENENISILLIDCNESPDIAEKYDIARVPTMIIYKNETTPVYRCQEVMLSQDIQKLIQEVC
jgi:thiol-disulfide isomerase/thioredoxin